MKKAKYVLAILLAVAMVVPAYALSIATDDGPFGASYNRRYYTPISCTVNIAEKTASFKNMKWENYVFESTDYWEGELRGTNGYSIDDAYAGASGITSNLPNAYYEYDEDDMSVGCKTASQTKPDQIYYAILTTTKGPQFNNGVELLVESECGIWGGPLNDGLPTHYQVFEQTLNTVSRRTVSW